MAYYAYFCTKKEIHLEFSGNICIFVAEKQVPKE